MSASIVAPGAFAPTVTYGSPAPFTHGTRPITVGAAHHVAAAPVVTYPAAPLTYSPPHAFAAPTVTHPVAHPITYIPPAVHPASVYGTTLPPVTAPLPVPPKVTYAAPLPTTMTMPHPAASPTIGYGHVPNVTYAAHPVTAAPITAPPATVHVPTAMPPPGTMTYAAPVVTQATPGMPGAIAGVGYADAHHVGQVAAPGCEAVVKMAIGDWQICEDQMGEYYVDCRTNQSYEQPPDELLLILQQHNIPLNTMPVYG